MATAAPARTECVYRARGAAIELFKTRASSVLLSGPAGTGKSRACLEKILACAVQYPESRHLIVRQTRASLSTTGLVTFEDRVLPPNQPWVGQCSRDHRTEYALPNGSAIVTGGLDRPDKIMSSDYDLIYVQEATEISEVAWEKLETRLRSNRLPYQQLIADCNPSAPTHWLKRRCDAGRCLMLHSRHEDNPLLYRNGGWTKEGEAYIERLENLTGALKLRLRHGIWAQASGVVYETWDAAKHVCEQFYIPPQWPRYLAIDFGFTNPFVCQWWTRDPDGRLYLYRELVQTKRIVSDLAAEVKKLHGNEPMPTAIYADHDAEDRATFTAATGWGTVGAVKSVAQGIQLVQARLKTAGDGRPRLFICRGSLVGRDPGLEDQKRPQGVLEEIDAYAWAEGVDGKPNKEEPVKENDHSMDALRYMVATLDGQQPTRVWLDGETI